MTFRLSTLSTEEQDGVQYNTGDLSLYPDLLDDKKSLYTVSNNAESKLIQTVPYNGKYIIVEDASAFPENGLLRIGKKNNKESFELVYYDKKIGNTFTNLVRGFAGSLQSVHNPDNVYVSNSVMAEHHNALKDALINIQGYVGTKNNPTEDSLNGLLKQLETEHLAPKPVFKAFPLKGPPGLAVRFQNFSNSESIRFLWDFGDGTSSAEKSPTHTYQNEGIYTVRLNMIMSTGAQGIAIKTDYITVSEKEIVPFFYANKTGSNTVEFVDQTDGDVAARYWVFDDGENEEVLNPNIHTIEHTYEKKGSYIPSLLIVFRDQSLKRVFLQEGIEIENDNP